ncbi:MAG: LysM peptidoglycan-binding domain-containing protein [Lachnospiraceae bacterium]|nr:LysM peptidoglycan-binding domain-containing protein [Lachnospiraceae bacterium]
MIEVIYEKENQEVAKSGWIPKNIRQIGNPQGEQKIYIEDYVVSYINKIARPENIYSRGAILVGETKNTKNGSAIFISGAIEAANLELDMDETVFNNETWTQIYDSIKSYFPDLEVVGWFLSRLGFSTQINEKIQKTHIENFSGKDKVLYVVDSLEKEDAFYLYDQGRLRKQTGYYIYYDRNENMQNYIQSKSETEERILNPIEVKDREVLTRVRSQVAKSEGKKKKNLMPQVAGFIFATGMLAIGITIMNNYDKMRNLEIKLEQLNLTMNQGQQEENLTLNASGNPSTSLIADENLSSFTEEGDGTEEGDSTEGNQDIAVLEGEVGENLMESSENTLEVGSEEVVETMAQNYYYVEEGDTLLSISLKIYQSGDYVKDIKEANHLEDENYIKIGQKLVLPAVQQ